MSPVRSRPRAGTGGATGTWLPRLTVLPDPWSSAGTLELRRSWPRGAGHVLLEYASTAAPAQRVVGQWLAEPGRVRRVAEAMSSAAGAEAAVLPELGIVLHGTGADRRLVPLRRLLDDPAAALVVHRPERRAVVRVDGSPADGAPRRWVKVVRPERATALLARTAWLAPLGPAVPRLLEAHVDEGVTVWEDLPGVPLGDLLDDARLGAAMTGTGRLLRRLHELPVPAGGVVHDADAEMRVLAQWTGHLATFFPVLHARVGTLVAWAAGLLEATDAAAGSSRVTVHRDLHDGQVLVAPGRVSLLDPDTVAAGEPELDVGNLIAHLTLAAIEGRCDAARAEVALRIALDVYGADALDDRRLRAYTAAALLRLVAVHAFRPATRACLPLLIEAAGRLLRRGGGATGELPLR